MHMMIDAFGQPKSAALWAVSILVIFNSSSFAQVTSGSVTGSVQDSTSAAIVGATLKLINTGTSVTQTTVSDNSGNFQFLLTQPGIYVLEASHPGFRTFRRDGVVV